MVRLSSESVIYFYIYNVTWCLPFDLYPDQLSFEISFWPRLISEVKHLSLFTERGNLNMHRSETCSLRLYRRVYYCTKSQISTFSVYSDQDASCEVITTCIQSKPSLIHMHRAWVQLKGNLPTDIMVKDHLQFCQFK